MKACPFHSRSFPFSPVSHHQLLGETAQLYRWVADEKMERTYTTNTTNTLRVHVDRWDRLRKDLLSLKSLVNWSEGESPSSTATDDSDYLTIVVVMSFMMTIMMIHLLVLQSSFFESSLLEIEIWKSIRTLSYLYSFLLTWLYGVDSFSCERARELKERNRKLVCE